MRTESRDQRGASELRPVLDHHLQQGLQRHAAHQMRYAHRTPSHPQTVPGSSELHGVRVRVAVRRPQLPRRAQVPGDLVPLRELESERAQLEATLPESQPTAGAAGEQEQPERSAQERPTE